MSFDRRGERQTCGKCRRPFYDLNRPGAECPHCHPRPTTAAPATTPEETSVMMPKEERYALLRKLLSEKPMTTGELLTHVPASPMTIRGDLLGIGATQQGNRLSPWTLPETPADAPVEKPVEEDEVVAEEVSAQSNATLVACVYEAKRRVAQLPELERLREALAS